MASPQLENGFTRIADEIVEHLVNTPLLGSEFQILFFVIRKTYGFSKKKDWISLTQFEKATNLSRPTVVRSLKNLVIKKLLVKSVKYEFSFNKNWEEWVVKTPLLVKYRDTTSKLTLTKTGKDTLTHNKQYTMTINNIAEQAPQIVSLIEKFSKLNPACKRMYGNTTQRIACVDLIEFYGFDRVEKVIEQTLPKTNALQFFPSITTPVQLRDKWATLENAIKKYQSEKLSKKKTIII